MPPLRQLLPDDSGARKARTDEPAAKRRNVSAACEACRQRKSKCDSIRPMCNACRTRGLQCRYLKTETRQIRQRYNEALKRESRLFGLIKSMTMEEALEVVRAIQAGDTIDMILDQFTGGGSNSRISRDPKLVYEDFYLLLKSRPEEDLTHILDLVKSGYDVESIIRRIRDGDLLPKLSLKPESQLRFNFPHFHKWPKFLSQARNPYLDTSLFEPDDLGTITVSQKKSDSAYNMPYQAAKLIKPASFDLKVSRWTNVTSDDVLLNQLLEVYWLHSYPFLTYFQKDIFLEDLSSGEDQFCSSLLVNAILASATHYLDSIPGRNEPWNASSISYRFFAEAKRLWEMEMGEAKITTLQAALVMNSIYNMDGLDRIGSLYMVNAVKMAYNLDLFAPLISEEPSKLNIAYQFTAWCLFSWQAMVTCHYYVPPLLKQPPSTDLPDPDKNPSFYGEIHIRYPQSDLVHSLNFPATFFHMTRFRIVLNSLALHLFEGAKKRLSIEETISYCRKLMQWFEDLPACLRPYNIVFPVQFQLHLHYQDVIQLLFTPFMATKSRTTWFMTPYGTNETVEGVVQEARIRFETILRIYYLRHSFTFYAPVMLQFLSKFGFAIAEQAKNAPPQRDGSDNITSSLLLAIQGLYHQGQAAHLSNAVFGLLYDMLPAESVAIADRHIGVKQLEKNKQNVSDYLRAAYPVNAVSLDDDAEEKRLNSLLRKLQS